MSASRQERKVVTALFCDLVGFTSQAEEMDPEDVASVLAPYHARLKEELERFGGTVEKFIGDAVMALFGAPVSHEDDPERAVRAALAIRGFAVQDGLELRIGIATGEALVTLDARPDAGETMATGDVVNTAARLQANAPVNGILVSEKTFQATGESIEFREAEAVSAKGKASPVVVWEAVAASTGVTPERGHATELVGRQRELDLLRGVLERVRVEREPQLVTLIGVPGIGKSRLVHELALETEDVEWHHGRCLPYGDGVTFRALGEIVRSLLGVRDGDTVAAVEGKLEGAVADEWVRSHLRPLLGLEPAGAGGDGPEEAYVAWRSFLETCAADAPITTVFEDLHWADDVLLDFIDHLVDWAGGVGLFVVCTSRPELLEGRPAWGGGKTNASTISLAALSDEETGRLVSSLVGRPLMAADVQSALLVRAGGNPLYAEQFALLLADRDDAVELPETVQGLIAARIDLLAPEQKTLLQDAAVVGRTFWLGSVAATSGVDARAAEVGLHALERKGFVRRERATSLAGQTEYTFQHVLVGDVAYGQIPRPVRSDKHRLAGEWISSVAEEGDTAELRAHHYGEALALARAARVETAPLETPARLAFRDAGDRAFELSAYAPAARLYERALELSPDSGLDHGQLLFARARAVHFGVDDARFELFDEARDALLGAGEIEAAAEAESLGALAVRNAGRGLDALERARAAVALVEGRPESRPKTYVIANSARLLAVLAFEYDEAIRVARLALAAARELGLRDLEAHCLNTIGVARVGLWDVDGITDLEESLRIGLEHCTPFEILRIYNNLASCYENAGFVPKADATYADALVLADRIGAPGRADLAINVAVSDYACGRWQEAWDRLHAMGGGTTPWRAGAEAFIAEMLFARDDLEGAVSVSERVLAAIRASQLDGDMAFVRQAWLGLRGVFAQAEGRDDKVAEIAQEILAMDPEPSQFYPIGVPWLTLMHIQLGLHDRVAALQVDGPLPWYEVARLMADGQLVEAANRLDQLGDLSLAAETRMVALRGLAADGRKTEIAEELPKVLAFYRSVGATRYVREAEALLPSVA